MAKDLESRISNRTPENNGQAPLSALIQNMQGEFQKAAPRGFEAAQLVRDALTCLRQTPQLAECDPQSVLGSLMTCSQIGLRPGVLGHAWLLPFWDSKAGGRKAQLVIGYQGLVELAHRSGQIQSLIARTVHEKDHFDVSYGLNDDLVHKPCLEADKGRPIAYYAVAKFVTGGHAFYVMGQQEMLAYRDNHATAQKNGQVFGPWKDHYEGMAQKGLAVDTPIPTQTGWSTMGELAVGDTVFDMHGRTATVSSKSEVKHIDCYRVTFHNGSSITCDGEHRWLAGVGINSARKVREKGWGVYEIGTLYAARAAGKPVTMPVAGELDTKEVDLPVHPWALGYWLGNGAARAGRVTCATEDADFVAEALSSRGFEVGTRRRDPRSNAEDIGIVGGFVTLLREAGVFMNKHVPPGYFRGSPGQRRELLRGLMDSDGSIDKRRGRAIFVSVDESLTNAVAELARSLGEVVSQRKQMNHGYGKDVVSHVVQWTPSFPPVSMPRKVARLRGRQVPNYRAVKSIEKVETVPTQCISVTSETRTYLAGTEMVPTHNTVVRQLAKWLPKSTDFSRALDVDNSVRVDLTPAAVDYTEHPEGHLDVDEDSGPVEGEVVE